MGNSLKIVSVGFILLGFVAFLLGERDSNSADDLALSFAGFDEIIKAPINKISAVDLADYLIKQEHHYNLIDLQGKESSYQIPTAESHTVQSFLDKKTPVNETIFLYTQHETEAIQLYYLLAIRGYFKVKVVSGGVAQWHNAILQPNTSFIEEGEIPFRQKLTEYFGGSFGAVGERLEIKKVLLEKKKKNHHGC